MGHVLSVHVVGAALVAGRLACPAGFETTMEKEMNGLAKNNCLRLAELYYLISNDPDYSIVAQAFWLERSWLFLLIWASGINPLENSDDR